MTLPCDCAAQRPLAHDVEGQLDLRHGAHRVVDPAAAEPPLGQHPGAVLRAEQVVGGHPHVAVPDVVVQGGVRP